jgi:hypothetical protein
MILVTGPTGNVGRLGGPARSFADLVTTHRDRLTTVGAGAAR